MSVTMEGGFDAPTLEQPNRSKGEYIRAKIAANRAKRLAIADAMKREAGVTGHEVHREEFGGLAFIGTGRIRSPEGRKILQLATVAHECGHFFLHNSGSYRARGNINARSSRLPSPARGLVASSLPRRLSKWGRTYVGSWIESNSLIHHFLRLAWGRFSAQWWLCHPRVAHQARQARVEPLRQYCRAARLGDSRLSPRRAFRVSNRPHHDVCRRRLPQD